MRRWAWAALVGCVVVVVAPGRDAEAARSKPPACPGGSFLVEEAASPLVPNGAAVPDMLTVGSDGATAIVSGCPTVPGKLKRAKRGTKLSATWSKKKGLCAGLEKRTKLKAQFDLACQNLSGTLKSKGLKQEFTATRVLGFGQPAVVPSRDDARHTTRTVGPAGGDVFARAADGSRYRLAIPPGALAAPVEVTLTPLVSLGGLPLEGGLVGGVDLQPAGLVFSLPATLYVAPAGGLPAETFASFGWSGAGDGFGIVPGWRDPEERWAALPVEHFSGYGLGIPGASQIDLVAVELLGFYADLEALLGSFPCLAVAACGADWEAVLVAYYDQLVAPRLAAGSAAGAVVEALGAHAALLAFKDAALATGVSAAPVVAGRLAAGLAANHANLVARRAEYSQPLCSGAVADWQDWMRVPEEVRLRAAALYGGTELDEFDLAKKDYCVSFAITDLVFPEEVAPDDTELALSFRTVVAAPGDEQIPVASSVTFAYTEGSSGADAIETEADGSAELTVERTLGTPLQVLVEIEATEALLDRPDLLIDSRQARAGSLDFIFDANLTPGPRPILGYEEEVEACVTVTVGPPAGQTVQFALDGPGTISDAVVTTFAVPDPILEVGRACTTYTAPDGPVVESAVAELHADLGFGGETYADTVSLHPRWADIALEADVGAGFETATNQSLFIGSDGPFLVEARLSGPGADTAAPPSQLDGEPLQVLADEPTLFLADCCSTVGVLESSDVGPSTFAFYANGSPTPLHTVDVIYGTPGGTASGASVSFDRLPPDLALLLPPLVTAGTPVSVEVQATRDGDPVPGLYVDLAASGGSVVDAAGTTGADGRFGTTGFLDPGALQLTVTATVRTAEGGEVIDVLSAVAATGESAAIVERLELLGFLPTPSPVPPRVELRGVHVGAVDLVLPSVVNLDGSLQSDVTLGPDGSISRVEATLSVENQGSTVGPRAVFHLVFRVVGPPVVADFQLAAGVTGGFGTFLNTASVAFDFGAFNGNPPGIGCVDVDTNGPVAGGCPFAGPSGSVVLGPGQDFHVRAEIQSQAMGTADASLVVDFTPAP